MDHQAQMNGSAESPARNVARNMADVWHDVLTLSELQARLVAIETRDVLEKSRAAIGLLAAGCLVALAALPILLAAGALFLVETTSLTPAAAFGLAALVGIVVAGCLCAWGWWVLRRSCGGFQRSGCEWRRNIEWFKNVLARGSAPAPQQSSHL
jgi:hypothetical protein